MRVTESLIRQNKLKRNKTKYNEDEEPTQCYREKGLERWTLNQTKTIFDSPYQDGINTRENLFDRQAVFRTKKD